MLKITYPVPVPRLRMITVPGYTPQVHTLLIHFESLSSRSLIRIWIWAVTLFNKSRLGTVQECSTRTEAYL
jgi:hypothetical protein